MPRDSSGNYTLPVGNPVISGTPISSAVQNSTMNDLAAALTNSLSRTGLGGMQSPLPFVSGNVGSPGITWVNDPTTGLYLSSAGDMRVAVGGVANTRWNASGQQLWDGSAWSQVLTVLGIGPALAPYTQSAVDEAITGNWTFPGLVSPSITAPTTLSFIIGSTPRGVYSATGLAITGTLGVSGAITQGGLAVVLSSRQLSGVTSIAGGGDLSADRTFSLVGDVGSPGTSWYYGTNASGTKGWFALSGVVGVPEAPIDGTTYGRNNASWIAVGGAGAFLPITGGTLTGPLIIDYATAQTVLTVKGAAPWLILQNDSSAAGAKKWGLDLAAVTFTIRTHTDPGSTGSDALVITRGAGASTIASMVYGNLTDVPTHTFRGLVIAANALNVTGTLAVTGAATVSTTLGVSGSTTLAALTASGNILANAQVQHRGGNGAYFFDNTNAASRSLNLDNGTKEIVVGTLGALWYWGSGTSLSRGSITIATVAPVGNDAALAGTIVLVYE